MSNFNNTDVKKKQTNIQYEKHYQFFFFFSKKVNENRRNEELEMLKFKTAWQQAKEKLNNQMFLFVLNILCETL